MSFLERKYNIGCLQEILKNFIHRSYNNNARINVWKETAVSSVILWFHEIQPLIKYNRNIFLEFLEANLLCKLHEFIIFFLKIGNVS